jgi:hypothetical protein
MKRARSRQHGSIPKDAVLLIPEPEGEYDPPTCGVQPGYYDAKQMLELIEKHKDNADAIQFIADMLETGNAEYDGFAVMLRENRKKPAALMKIVKSCKE